MRSRAVSNTGWIAAGVAVLGAVATAAWVETKSRRAEKEHPPEGAYVSVDGVDLHYVERGEGPPVVLIHGNAVSLEDFEASGLIDQLASSHHVIAFDRPGFGHSSRPRDRLWTPSAQARLLHSALEKLGVDRPSLVGHSMGTLVALEMALQRPERVAALVLISGYYYPTVRIDAIVTAPVALPVLGDVMRYTVSAVSARLLIGKAIEKMFSPKKVPSRFEPMLSKEMMVRPQQIRANAEDAAFMMPAASSCSKRYSELSMPVTILAGQDDEVVDFESHAVQLHRDVSQSELIVVPGEGHMVHYSQQDVIESAVKGEGGVARLATRGVGEPAGAS